MKVTDVEFASRALNPRWNAKASMAKRIRDFLDVPTRAPARYQILTQADRDIARYSAQIQALRAHINCREVIYLIQAGVVP